MKKILLLIAVINALLIVITFGPRLNKLDTDCYVNAARLLLDMPGGFDCGYRIIKPLPLIFVGFFEKITGINGSHALFLQNLIFYLFSTLLIYEITNLILKTEKLAFWSGLIFITSPPIFAYGLAFLTDMMGWFFTILGFFLTIKFFDDFKKSPILTTGFGFLMGLGLLYKESALGGSLFFSIYTLLQNIPLKNKIRMIGSAIFGLLLPVVASSLIIYRLAHYSFFDWYIFNQKKPFGDYYNLAYLIRNIASTFYVYWLLFLIGAFRLIKELRLRAISPQLLHFFLAGGVTLVLWIPWPYPMNRIFFLSAPFLVGMASYGVGGWKKPWGWIFIFSTVSISITTLLYYYRSRT